MRRSAVTKNTKTTAQNKSIDLRLPLIRRPSLNRIFEKRINTNYCYNTLAQVPLYVCVCLQKYRGMSMKSEKKNIFIGEHLTFNGRKMHYSFRVIDGRVD